MLNVVPSSVLSVGILANNIAVSLLAFCLGVFFGLGTFYIIATNGLMLGGIFAFTHQHGMAGELLKFVIAHGFVELSVICLAGAAGVMLGESLIRPTHATRRESFQHAAGKTSRLLVLCALLLVGLRLHRRLHFAGPGLPDDESRCHRLRVLGRDGRRAERPVVRLRRSGFSPTTRVGLKPDLHAAASPELRISLEHRPLQLVRAREQRRRAECTQCRGIARETSAILLGGQRFVRIQPPRRRVRQRLASGLASPAINGRCFGNSSRAADASWPATVASSRSVSITTRLRCRTSGRMRSAAFNGFDSAAAGCAAASIAVSAAPCRCRAPARSRRAADPQTAPADPIILHDCMLREARGQIRVVTEAIEVARAQCAGASRIDRDDDLEMLIFGEIATDQAAAACRRLPVDHMLRIAAAIFAQLQHFRAGADTIARGARDWPRTARGIVAQQVGHDVQRELRGNGRVHHASPSGPATRARSGGHIC